MNKKVSLTALVTGMPPFIHMPLTQKGETKLQFLVRYHPDEWNNFIERMKKDFGASERTVKQLKSLQVSAITDPIIISNAEHWMNHRLPVHGRTLEGLFELRKHLNETPIANVEFMQILWPREKNPGGDTSAEKLASEMGAEVISLETGANRELNLAKFLQSIRGDFLWVVPGGSRIDLLAAMSFLRIFSQMNSNSQCALYFDGSYSAIYRVSALKQIAGKNGFISANLQDVGRELQQEGYSICGDRDRQASLCEIEEIYGGNYPYPKPQKKGFWGRF
jgi:hypothetical protein